MLQPVSRCLVKVQVDFLTTARIANILTHPSTTARVSMFYHGLVLTRFAVQKMATTAPGANPSGPADNTATTAPVTTAPVATTQPTSGAPATTGPADTTGTTSPGQVTITVVSGLFLVLQV